MLDLMLYVLVDEPENCLLSLSLLCKDKRSVTDLALKCLLFVSILFQVSTVQDGGLYTEAANLLGLN